MGDQLLKIVKPLAILGVFVLFLTLGDSLRYTSSFLNTAALPTGAAYGEKLGQTIDDVVNTIHATVKGSLITHADVLAILCMEQGGANPNLQTRITSHAGAKGLTQVMPGTFNLYARKGTGGFSQIGCSYAQVQTNPRCSIEAGARIFNDLLMRYGGNRTTAARAYNGGPGRAYGSLPNETRNYAYVKLPQCMNAIIASKTPIRSTVWQAMVSKVSSITNGTFRLLGNGKLVPLSASGWTDIASNPQDRLRQITSSFFGNNSNGQNPIGRFLGIPQQSSSPQQGINTTLASNQPPILRDSTPSSNGTTAGNLNLGDVDFLSSPTPTSTSTPATSTQSKTIKNATPTLLCLPSPINPGESTLILWSCRDGAYKTTSENFDSNEDLIGSTRVSPTRDTTYTLTCVNDQDSNDTAASCTVEVANPALALITTPRIANRGQSVSISWKTTDTNSCVLTSSEHPSFERRGTEGEAISASLTTNTTFTLTCETSTGTIQERSVGVGVE